tara:strand:+ start:27 stop:947 length:921 start_codon:yes stop_codon:yes gene_type:complete
MKNKNLVVILCYCDTKEKLDILKNTISILKNNFNILITTHSTIPSDIQQDIDYLVYDKSNPILHYPERGMKFWKTILGNIKISHIKDDYGWTVFNLIKNFISYSQTLDYTHYSIINYDTEITPEILNLLNSPKDFICSNYIDPATDKPLFPGLLFNTINKENIFKVNNLLSRKEYTKTSPNTNISLYSDAETYWGSILKKFKYVKTDIKVKGILECGNPDVLNYNTHNTIFKLFFSVNNQKMLIYDNFNQNNIKLNINGKDIYLNQINKVLNLDSIIQNLGYYSGEDLIDITHTYNIDKYNKIENL